MRKKQRHRGHEFRPELIETILRKTTRIAASCFAACVLCVGAATAHAKDGPDKGQPAPPAIRVLGDGPFQGAGAYCAIALSPNGTQIATACCRKNTLRIWNIERAEQLLEIPFPKGLVQAMWYLDDGRHLAILKYEMFDYSVVLFDLREGEEKQQVPACVDARTFTLAPDGKTVVMAASEDPKPLELTKEEEEKIGRGGKPMRVSREEFRARTARNSVAAFDLKTGKRLWKIEQVARKTFRKDGGRRKYVVKQVVFSPDQKRILCVDTGGSFSQSVGPDNSLRFSMWDVKTRKMITDWQLPKEFAIDEGDPSTVIWSKGNEHILVQAYSRKQKQSTTLLVAPKTGKISDEIPGTGMLTKDGLFVSCDLKRKEIVSYNIKTRAIASSFKIDAAPKRPLQNVLVSRNGRWLIGYYESSLFVFDLKNKKQTSPLATAHKGRRHSQFLADGTLIHDDTACTRMYDGETGEVIATTELSMWGGYTAFGRQGIRAFSGGKLWDLISGKTTSKLGRGGGRSFLSGSGRLGIVVDTDRDVTRVYDLVAGKLLFKRDGIRSGRSKHLEVKACRWNADETRLFVADVTGRWFHDRDRNEDPKLAGTLGYTGILDARTGKLLKRFRMPEGNGEVEQAWALELLEAKDLVYMKVWHENASFHGLWKASDGSFVRLLPAMDDWRNYRFLYDGKSMVSNLNIVDIATGKETLRYTATQSRSFSPSNTLFAGWQKDDDTVAFYSVRTGKEHWRFAARPEDKQGDIQWVQWHPTEARLAVTLKGSLAVLLVDPYAEAATPAPQKDIGKLVEGLKSKDGKTYRDAVRGLIAQGGATIKAVESLLTADDVSTAERALFTLEWLARKGSLPARKRIEAVSMQKGLLAACAADALHRLKLAEQTEALRKKNDELRRAAKK